MNPRIIIVVDISYVATERNGMNLFEPEVEREVKSSVKDRKLPETSCSQKNMSEFRMRRPFVFGDGSSHKCQIAVHN